MAHKHVIQELLDREMVTWAAKPYQELGQIDEGSPVKYPVDFENREFRIEVDKEEETANHIRLVVAVYAASFGDFVPLAGELTVHRDGRVEKKPRVFPH